MSKRVALLRYISGLSYIDRQREKHAARPPLEFGTSKKTTAAASKPKHPSAAGPGKGKGPGSVATNPESTFSAAEDVRILAWKAADARRPWRELAAELGKPSGALKERYKELCAGGHYGPAAAQGGYNDRGRGAGKKGAADRKGASADADDAEEARLVRMLVAQDDEERWMRIASRLFDWTGVAANPERLKAKYGRVM